MTRTSTHVGSERSFDQAQTHVPSTLPAEAPRLFAARRSQARFLVRRVELLSPVFGAVIEVSAAGLQLESAAPLFTGASYVFRLSVGGRFLSRPGRVAWSRLDRFESTGRGTRPVFQAGIDLEAAPGARAWRSALARAHVTISV